MRLFFSVFLAATLFCFSASGSEAALKIAVLGFDSEQLNEVQDRLLRETLLREIHDKGYTIVPVMIIESFSLDESGTDIRKLDEERIKHLCRKMKADFVISGKLYPDNKNSEDRMIIEGNVYLTDIIFYSRRLDKFYILKLETKGKKDLYSYFKSLSHIILRKMDEVLNKP